MVESRHGAMNVNAALKYFRLRRNMAVVTGVIAWKFNWQPWKVQLNAYS